MSEYEHRYKRPHQYKSKLIVDGTVDKVKQLKAEKKSFAEIGSIIGKSRQQKDNCVGVVRMPVAVEKICKKNYFDSYSCSIDYRIL